MDTNYYFEVVAKCGHVGRGHYVPISFAIEARDGKEAARIARQLPRVKHHHKHAILSVSKINFERYQEIIREHHNDPYLRCRSKHEQIKIENLEDRTLIDPRNQRVKYDKKERQERVAYKLKKNRILDKLYVEDLAYAYEY